MPRLDPFAYALLRVVPDAERGEAVNVGVVLFCRARDYLQLRTALPVDKLRALDPAADLDAIAGHLRALELIAAGNPEAGRVAANSASSRFHWLVAPTSTVVQPSAVHTGLCADPPKTMEKLFGQLVS